jgi:hypothetical protein
MSDSPTGMSERQALLAVERAARAYAEHSHGNLAGEHYRAREEARDQLLDALSRLDLARSPVRNRIAIQRDLPIS